MTENPTLLVEADIDAIITELSSRYVSGVLVVKPRGRVEPFAPSVVHSFGDADICLGLAVRSADYMREYVATGDDIFGEDPDIPEHQGDDDDTGPD